MQGSVVTAKTTSERPSRGLPSKCVLELHQQLVRIALPPIGELAKVE